ncbi:hypothetical protein Q3G72_029137 [Acer saccharum]|nr:hypothetical protein Q3G72_029137 [Acer saccharum]
MLLLDSYYDEYKGVICHVAVVDGALHKGDKISSAGFSQSYEVLDVGIMHPELTPTGVLLTVQVGYIVIGMRSTKEARIGDTLYHSKSTVEPLPGFKPAKHMVFSGLFPADGSDFEALNYAIETLTCNDASVSVTKESSTALGLGFMCGFLGLLHKDDFHQRLEQVILPSFATCNETQLGIFLELLSLEGSICYGALSLYQQSDLVKLDILLNGQPVDAMTTIVHKLKAQRLGRDLVEKLKKFIDRQMFEIIIQAAIGSKVVARETISAMRKNVLAKCYGGDITRKKLLEKQKEGKKQMKHVGSVDIPQEARHELLKNTNEQEDDFASLREYSDHLEEVEDMILFNLIDGVDVHVIEEKIQQYQKENTEHIIINQARKAEEVAAVLTASKADHVQNDTDEVTNFFCCKPVLLLFSIADGATKSSGYLDDSMDRMPCLDHYFEPFSSSHVSIVATSQVPVSMVKLKLKLSKYKPKLT